MSAPESRWKNEGEGGGAATLELNAVLMGMTGVLVDCGIEGPVPELLDEKYLLKKPPPVLGGIDALACGVARPAGVSKAGDVSCSFAEDCPCDASTDADVLGAEKN